MRIMGSIRLGRARRSGCRTRPSTASAGAAPLWGPIPWRRSAPATTCGANWRKFSGLRSGMPPAALCSDGLALGFIFVPLSTTSVGTLPKEEIGKATGIYNLMRNVGGSVGISLVTTLLARHAQAHQAILAQHVSPYDAEAAQRLRELEALFAPRVGSQAAAAAAQAALYSMVVRQAMLLDFVDNFRLMAVLALCCVPIVFVLRRTRPASERGGPPPGPPHPPPPRLAPGGPGRPPALAQGP